MRAAPTRQPCIDGGARTAKQLRDLFDLALFEVAQHQHFAIAVRERLQRGVRRREPFVAGAGLAPRHRFGRSGGKPAEQLLPHRRAAHVVLRLAQRDAVQPRRPLRVAAKLVAMAPRREQRFLHDVVDFAGLRGPAEQPVHEPAKPRCFGRERRGRSDGMTVIGRRQRGVPGRENLCDVGHAGRACAALDTEACGF